MSEVIFKSLLRNGPEIGANSYSLQSKSGHVVLDSGMHPKGLGYDALPDFRGLGETPVDAVVLTHSHLDHCGSLPVLLRRQVAAPVYLTALTGEFVETMLHNSCNVMSAQKEQEDIKEYPLFTHREVEATARRFLTPAVGRPFELGHSGMTAQFYDAGHLPGSVGVMLDTGSLRIFYTGDVHFENQTLSQAAQFPEDGCDVLIMECTRGAAERRADYSREEEAMRMAATMMRALERGGAVLMPVFALGKTQEMLLIVKELQRTGHLRTKLPIHIGGLSTSMTRIIDKHASDPHRGHQGFRILDSMDGVITPKRGTRDIPLSPGRLYALSSGMMNENTVSNDFAFRFLDNPKNTLCFVGYCDSASPAGSILRAAPGDPIKLHHSHPPVPLHATVERFDFSGHAPREALVDYAVKMRPRKLLLVHGDGPALEWMRHAVQARLPDTMILVPQPGEPIRLDG